MKRLLPFLLCVLCALCGGSSFAQTRIISRTNDVRAVSPPDRLLWFAGETVEYNLYTRRAGVVVPFSNDAVAVWSVVDTGLTNFYVRSTGTVISATNGHARWTLSASQSALTSGTYQSFATITASGGSLVADRALALVAPNAEWNGSFVGPNTNRFSMIDGDTLALDAFWIRYSSNIADIVGSDFVTTAELAAAVSGLGSTNVTPANLIANGGAGLTTGTLYRGDWGDAASNLAALAYAEATNVAAGTNGFVLKTGDTMSGPLTTTTLRASTRVTTPTLNANSVTFSNVAGVPAQGVSRICSDGNGYVADTLRVGTQYVWMAYQPSSNNGLKIGFWNLGEIPENNFETNALIIKPSGAEGVFSGNFIGDGSGLVNLPSSGGLTTNSFAASATVTFSSTGGVMSAEAKSGSGVVDIMFTAPVQIITNGTFTKVQASTVTTNVGGYWDVTNYQARLPVGTYLACASASAYFSSPTGSIIVSFRRNGSEIRRLLRAGPVTLGGPTPTYLAGGSNSSLIDETSGTNIYDFAIYQDSGSTCTNISTPGVATMAIVKLGH